MVLVGGGSMRPQAKLSRGRHAKRVERFPPVITIIEV